MIELQVLGSMESGVLVQVSDAFLSSEINYSLIQQLVVAYQAGGRAGTKAQKNRSDVRGGGAKPWNQKGTGRARAGSNCSPLWRTGGVTFAARTRDFSQKFNKKMYRAAMRMIFSELNRQGRLFIFDQLKLESPKTRLLMHWLHQTDLHSVDVATQRILFVVDEWDEFLYLSARNVPNVVLTNSHALNPIELIAADCVLLSVTALKQIEERLI